MDCPDTDVSAAGKRQSIPTQTARVTVVITTYNRPELLKTAVRSALAQTFTDISVVVLDDGSITATADALSQFEDPRLSLIRNHQNLGITRTMQRGFSLAEGEYFMLFADDDALAPTFVETCVRALDDTPDAIAAATRSYTINAEGAISGIPESADTPSPTGCVSADEFARRYFTQTPSARMYIAAMLFRTEFVRQYGLQYPDEGFARCSDDLFLARMASTGLPVVLLSGRLYMRRSHAAMNSAASPDAIQELLRAAHAGLHHPALTNHLREMFTRFVLQSAFQLTRDESYGRAKSDARTIRASIAEMGLRMRDVLQGWGWRRRVEFAGPLGMWAVRGSQRMRLALRRRSAT